jgi:glycosyltransferase involved in cell wall biosynthesis
MIWTGFIAINKIMKICLINNLYKPYQRGGAEKIVELTAVGLSGRGHEVFVISTKPRFCAERTDDKSLKVYRISSCYFHLGRIWLPFRLFWHIWDLFNPLSYFKIKKILEKERPDAVITHNLKGVGGVLPLLLKMIRIKHLHVLHDIQLLHPSGLMYLGKEKVLDTVFAKTYQTINKKLFSFADAVVSPSKWLMAEHENRNFFKHSKKIIQPNPVDLQEPVTVGQKEGDVFSFLYVGHLSEAKGIFVLYDAFRCLKDIFKNRKIKLVIVGNDLLAKKEKSFLSQPDVEYAGILRADALQEFYKTCDCLVMPSLCYENSPTVIYEAASCGLPVISSSIGGAKELIEDLGGILFKAGDADDLRGKMEEAIKKPDLLESISRKELESIKKYQSEFYMEKLLKIIRG